VAQLGGGAKRILWGGGREDLKQRIRGMEGRESKDGSE